MKAACALAAGIGIGDALSVFFAPKSGEETRKWVANKCFNAIDAANEKVWQSRLHIREIVSRVNKRLAKLLRQDENHLERKKRLKVL
jgi:gas vesicle protein